MLDTAQALTLALAQHRRGLHGILAAEQAQLAPVAVSGGTVDRVWGSAQLEAALVFNAQALFLGRAANQGREISVQG